MSTKPGEVQDLNKYRTGLLHKRGIADLQPHNYVGEQARETPLRKVFGVLHEQHSKNTALLLVALALLTDKLVELDPPLFAKEDLPTERKLAELPKRFEEEEASVTKAIDEARALWSDQELGELFAARARVRRRLSKHREALADLWEAVGRGVEPKSAIFCEIGITSMDLRDEGKDSAAVDAFTEAITLAPDMDKAYIGRALAYENLGDLPSAEADLNVIIPRVLRPAELLEKRGQCRLVLGRYADALADFDAAAALGHEPLDLMTGRGVALRELGDYATSLTTLSTAVDRYPDAVVARTHRATALIAAGDIAAARADLDRIIENAADHAGAPAAFSIRAALRAQAGDRAGAVADLQQAIARSKDSQFDELVALLAEMATDPNPELD